MTKTQKIISIIILMVFILSSLFAILPNNFSNNIENIKNKKYDNVEEIKQLVLEKENIEFFSFFCPHCYDFEYKYGIVPEIKNNNIQLNQYHVDFLTSNSNVFTEAWSVAMILKAKNNLFNLEEVKARLFNLAQNPNGNGLKIYNVNELYDLVFKDLIDWVSFETLFKSEEVQKLTLKQKMLSNLLKIRSVPSFFQINSNLENDIRINHIDTSKYHENGVKTVKEFREQIIKDLKD